MPRPPRRGWLIVTKRYGQWTTEGIGDEVMLSPEEALETLAHMIQASSPGDGWREGTYRIVAEEDIDDQVPAAALLIDGDMEYSADQVLAECQR